MLALVLAAQQVVLALVPAQVVPLVVQFVGHFLVLEAYASFHDCCCLMMMLVKVRNSTLDSSCYPNYCFCLEVGTWRGGPPQGKTLRKTPAACL